jgi:NAD(P)-dependent dehydrogenase (short-subunit alcohol dehydrogenase family)
VDLGLAGRAFLVTGGSRGVGYAVVSVLLAEGALVATCARDGDALRAAWRRLPSADTARLLLRACDVRDRPRMSEFVTQAASQFGRLDGVVANAGAGAAGGVLDTPAATWDAQFSLKIHGILNLAVPAVPHLSGSRAGAIVIVNGVTGKAPEPDLAAVGAARAAVLNLALCLARELAGRQIRVNVVNLGPIVTSRQRARHAAAGSTVSFEAWCESEAVRRRVPMRRLGEPSEVAPAVAFLLSPAAGYITASTLDVAGGLGAHL